MNTLDMFEAREILRYVNFTDKEMRELLRYQLYVLVQSNSKGKVEAKDIYPLPWDNRFLNEREFEYSEEEAKVKEEESRKFEDMLNSGMINFESTNLMEAKSKKKENGKMENI